MKEGKLEPDNRILQGLDWLINSIRRDLRSVNRRVRAEHAQYLAQEEHKRRQRLERGKQRRDKSSASSIKAVAPSGVFTTGPDYNRLNHEHHNGAFIMFHSGLPTILAWSYTRAIQQSVVSNCVQQHLRYNSMLQMHQR